MDITVEFDEKLKNITKQKSFISHCSNGLTFLEFLYFLFESYPQIQEKYPPGVIGMAVNDLKPSDFTQLREGDVIKLWVVKEKIN